VDEPVSDLCARIQAFDPAVLAGYPSALDMLAREQRAGRLQLDLMLVGTSGENLDPGVRDRLQAAFGCEVRDSYGTSETVFMAFGCSQNWLHLSSDWFLLEPVEADGSPTPYGRYSATALVTNLANHLQPIIRYDIGDSVMFHEGTCACGSPLPAFRVAGRDADVLLLRAEDGRAVTVLPLLLGTVADSTPGTCRTQVLQMGSSALRVRGEVMADHDPATVWRELGAKLRVALDGQGLPNVTIEIATDEPEHVTASGKFRRVVPLPGAR
jgi:phenylacetate-coenzyme A ligase PaaK-like adenylate-forming protein